MVRLRTAPIAASLFGLMVLAGCQHTHKHNNAGCPCSCQASPAITASPSTPAVSPMTPVIGQPTSRAVVPSNSLQVE